MKYSRRTLSLVAILVGAAVSFYFLRSLRDGSAEVTGVSLPISESVDAERSAVVAPRASESHAPEHDEIVSTTISPQPANATDLLPPDGVALADLYPELKARADAGDARANCRLALELNRCRQVAIALDAASDLVAAHRTDAAQNATTAAELVAMSERDAGICGHAPPEDPDNSWRYLLRAAQAGHVPSILRFVIEPPLDEVDFVADMEGWEAYRRFAPELLRFAADSGDVRAIYHAYLLSMGVTAPGGTDTFPRGEIRAVVYGTAALPYLDDAGVRRVSMRLERIRASSDAETFASAVSEGRALRVGPGAGTNAEPRPLDTRQRMIPEGVDDCSH